MTDIYLSIQVLNVSYLRSNPHFDRQLLIWCELLCSTNFCGSLLLKWILWSKCNHRLLWVTRKCIIHVRVWRVFMYTYMFVYICMQ